MLRTFRFGLGGLCLAGILSVTGCSTTPPRLMSESLHKFDVTADTAAVEAAESFNKSWWRSLGLPDLDELLDDATQNNFTVQAAELRLNEAQGLDASSFWSLLPKSSLQFSESGGVVPQYRVDGFKSQAQKGVSATSRAGLSMSWALPLFGKASSTTALSKAQVEYARWTLEAARDTVATEVVLAYVEALGIRSMSAALVQIRDAERQQVEDTTLLLQKGLVAQKAVDDHENQVLQAESALLDAEGRLATLQAKVGTLLGNPDSKLMSRLIPWTAVPEVATTQFQEAITRLENRTRVDAAGIRQRIDVKLAESKVAEATAQAGIATANLFPQFSLDGALNFAKGSLDSTGVTKGISSLGSLDFGLRIPILEWPALKADANAKKVELQAAVMDYRAAVLAAWEDATSSAAEAATALRKAQLADRQEQLARMDAARQSKAAAKSYVSRPDARQAQEAHSSALKAKYQADTAYLLAWTKLRKASGGWVR